MVDAVLEDYRTAPLDDREKALFAFKPDRTEHLAQFTQGVMRGPSPLSPGQRELIAAFTSRRNDCPF